MQHHFRTREANLRQTHGARAGPRLDSLFEQSRLLLSKLKHVPKPSFQGSPSSRLNHRMLKRPDLSAQTPAPTGRNTEVHNRDQTLDLPLSSGPAGMMNPIALHSPPFARGLDPSWSEQGIPGSAPVLAAWHLKSSAGSSGSE